MKICKCANYKTAVNTYIDVVKRSEDYYRKLKIFFRQIEYSGKYHLELFECDVCGQKWVADCICSERQGGGWLCPVQVSSFDETVISELSGFACKIIEKHNDEVFYNSLNADITNDKCNENNCQKNRINLSKFCADHHFEMLKGRKFLKRSVK